MKVLLQRVSGADVSVNNETVGKISAGLLLFVGIDKKDDATSLEKMAHKILNYRVFTDEQGKMNQSVQDIKADILVISQFTLSANTQKGLRPSFSSAADPEIAKRYYADFVGLLRDSGLYIAEGIFGANMQVSLCNDGPVTFMLEV